VGKHLSVCRRRNRGLVLSAQGGKVCAGGAARSDLLDIKICPGKTAASCWPTSKDDADLKSIPVVVLTTSASERDILMAYELHANCYITKPVDLGQFMNVVKTIESFWFTIVKLPGGRDTKKSILFEPGSAMAVLNARTEVLR